jgi:hypothetical protein
MNFAKRLEQLEHLARRQANVPAPAPRPPSSVAYAHDFVHPATGEWTRVQAVYVDRGPHYDPTDD